MALLPIAEMISRQWRLPGIPGSTVVVQHLTLWIAFLGAALAARDGRLLSLSANTLLAERWLGRVRISVSAVGAAIATCLAWAAFQFVNAERLDGALLTPLLPRWVAESAMPAGFLAVALVIVWHAAPSARG